MSGTSLDGVDFCLADFHFNNGKWRFEILAADTFPYEKKWAERLIFDENISGEELLQLDADYGKLLADLVLQFIENQNIDASHLDCISSHGHTFFHRPEKGFTFQLGGGPQIFAKTKNPTVTDFRRQDVALGGQGAPLVPIGDSLLFSDYDACLNLGGFANISFEKDQKRLAFDICPINFVMNFLSQKLGKEYDKNGEIARQGELIPALSNELNSLDFYQKKPPKSLGAEWVAEHIFPLLKKNDLSIANLLNTFAEHSANQISNVLNSNDLKTCLATGGGAFNGFLMERIQAKTDCEIIKPDAKIINYKEALIFAFMGVLKMRGEVNVLAAATGARGNHSSGIFYH